MTPNAVGWFEIYVQDMKRAKPFYETVLQRTLEKLDSPGMEMCAFPLIKDCMGAAGSLVQVEGFPSGGNSTLVYFNCEDCAVESARVAGAGGRVQRDKTSIGPYGFIALCFDTEGNMFGLHSMK
jgi:predicted enzyme related to lactoylglutathione lyase